VPQPSCRRVRFLRSDGVGWPGAVRPATHHRFSGARRRTPRGGACVAQQQDGGLVNAGQVRFGFAGKGLWGVLDGLRDGPVDKGVIAVRPALQAEIKFFGRHKGGAIRDGVILSVHGPKIAVLDQLWSCDCDDVVEAFDTADIDRRELPAV
jgi:hypothetical protein